MTIRSHDAIVACQKALNAGLVLHFRDGDTTYTAGRDVSALGDSGWAIHSYRRGAVDADTAFWGASHLARNLVAQFGKVVAYESATSAIGKSNL